jgi:hypothetical protein
MANNIHIHLHDAVRVRKPVRTAVRDCGCAACQKKAKDAQQAYKGYLISGPSPMDDLYYISKGGHHIGTASTLQAAKQIIDQIATNDQHGEEPSGGVRA